MFITLITPIGEKQVPISITENEASSDMEIRVVFEGKELKGYCKDAVLPKRLHSFKSSFPRTL